MGKETSPCEKSQLGKGVEHTWRSLWRRKAGLVVQRVVDHVPAVFVMADLAGGVVLENDSPGFANAIVAENPRAWPVRFDLFELIDGAVVPLDSPRDVLTVGAALD